MRVLPIISYVVVNSGQGKILNSESKNFIFKNYKVELNGYKNLVNNLSLRYLVDSSLENLFDTTLDTEAYVVLQERNLACQYAISIYKCKDYGTFCGSFQHYYLLSSFFNPVTRDQW